MTQRRRVCGERGTLGWTKINLEKDYIAMPHEGHTSHTVRTGTRSTGNARRKYRACTTCICQTHTTMHVEHRGTTREDISCWADMESGSVAGEGLRHSMNSERGSVVELGPVLHMAARVGGGGSAGNLMAYRR